MQLVSMGFDMEGCKKAVFHTHNQGGSTGVCCNLSYHVLPLYMTLGPHLQCKGDGQAGHCYETASKCTSSVARAIHYDTFIGGHSVSEVGMPFAEQGSSFDLPWSTVK